MCLFDLFVSFELFSSGNLLVSDLKDVLTTDRVRKATDQIPQVVFEESTFFKTLVVILPRFVDKLFFYLHTRMLQFRLPWRFLHPCFGLLLTVGKMFAVRSKINFGRHTSLLTMNLWSWQTALPSPLLCLDLQCKAALGLCVCV